MNAFPALEAVCRAMSTPEFYPHPVSVLERRDTHISTVFLTGEWAYKLKKPVDFGFLDFTSLDARRRYCEREVMLNRRLSCDVYDGVVEIRRDRQGRLTLGGNGEIVEVAVRMKQLPDDSRLDLLIRGADEALLEVMDRLGAILAGFYELSPKSPEIDQYGEPGAIEFNMEENFRQMEPFIGSFVERQQWEFIRQVNRAFFCIRRDLFAARLSAGRIRDGHGDLRAEHIYFHKGIQIIDCIEFNDRFRYGDVIADLAFLHMDMEHLGKPNLSRRFLSAYARKAGDPHLYTLLDFYAAYRAIVKLKVTCLRSTEIENEEEIAQLKIIAESFARLAYKYSVQFSRPSLWVFCGLPASGKSLFARMIADIFSMDLFQSDVVRKEMSGLNLLQQRIEPFGKGLYRPELRGMVYGQMLALAQDSLKSGRSVVLDATFSLRKWREDAARLASDIDTNFILVECLGSEETIRKRLKEREGKETASDARLQHLPGIRKSFESLTEVPEECHVRLDTDGPSDAVLMELLDQAHARKCAQTDILLRRKLVA
jgi:hypothetical protein